MDQESQTIRKIIVVLSIILFTLLSVAVILAVSIVLPELREWGLIAGIPESLEDISLRANAAIASSLASIAVTFVIAILVFISVGEMVEERLLDISKKIDRLSK